MQRQISIPNRERYAFPKILAYRSRRLEPCLGLARDAHRYMIRNWTAPLRSSERRSHANPLTPWSVSRASRLRAPASSMTRLRHRCWLRARSLALRATCALHAAGQHTAALACTRARFDHAPHALIGARLACAAGAETSCCWSYVVEGMCCR